MLNWEMYNSKSDEFRNNKPFPHIFMKNILNQDIYDQLYDEWPNDEHFRLVKETMKRYHHGPSRYLDEDVQHNHHFPELSDAWNNFVSYLCSEEYISNLKNITGLEITKLTEFSIVDGLKGDYIHPHVDSSAMQKDNADITSIFYFAKNWKKEYGGATCILRDSSYDNIVYEPEDLDNSYLAFMQKENSWHGYKRIMVNNHRRAVLVTHG